MFQSTLTKILPQLDTIYDRLGLQAADRDGLFSSPTDECDQYLPSGLILVDVGEVHLGTAHRLNFDHNGRLVGIFTKDFTPDMVIFEDISDEYPDLVLPLE